MRAMLKWPELIMQTIVSTLCTQGSPAIENLVLRQQRRYWNIGVLWSKNAAVIGKRCSWQRGGSGYWKWQCAWVTASRWFTSFVYESSRIEHHDE